MKTIVGRKSLTSKEVARLLCVSEASVKRWADGGLLPALKTAGGHRRFRPEDVAVFRRDGLEREAKGALRRGGASRRAARATPDAAALDQTLSRQLFETIVGGHEEAAGAALVSLYLQGHTVARVADRALCPALRKVGDLWYAGELSVAQEHLATRTALSALQALRASLNVGEREGTRVGACGSVEGDFHELPVHLAALTMEAQGWSVVNLGVNTPFYALSEVIRRFEPRVVCVASTVFTHTDRAVREYGEFGAAVARAGASVILGGGGFLAEGVRRRFPADLHAETFSQLEDYVVALEAEAAGVD
jgi:MerR family transcriptional regulator, light-induced transcriptional regulator